MRYCYISKNYKDLKLAGNKAKTDIEFILEKNGFKNLGLPLNTNENNIFAYLYTMTSVTKAILSIKKDDVIVIQYPFKKYFETICKAAHRKGAKTIAVIHDLGSFRRSKLTIEKEINRLNLCDYVIAHNEAMEKWVLENGYKGQTGTLGIFDYLSEKNNRNTSLSNDKKDKYNIIYAGQLSKRKNSFLYDFNVNTANFRFNLYGKGFDKADIYDESMFSYKGFIPSDELIENVNGDFGLVWDGNSLDSCSGSFGEYLKFNNPHKTSLYLRCGLPIIIWKEAALAGFIKNNNLGLCIDSLNDLDNILAELKPEDYKEMKKNAEAFCGKLQNGEFISKAICDITKGIKS